VGAAAPRRRRLHPAELTSATSAPSRQALPSSSARPAAHSSSWRRSLPAARPRAPSSAQDRVGHFPVNGSSGRFPAVSPQDFPMTFPRRTPVTGAKALQTCLDAPPPGRTSELRRAASTVRRFRCRPRRRAERRHAQARRRTLLLLHCRAVPPPSAPVSRALFLLVDAAPGLLIFLPCKSPAEPRHPAPCTSRRAARRPPNAASRAASTGQSAAEPPQTSWSPEPTLLAELPPPYCRSPPLSFCRRCRVAVSSCCAASRRPFSRADVQPAFEPSLAGHQPTLAQAAGPACNSTEHAAWPTSSRTL
jgi:hypothetical protein